MVKKKKKRRNFVWEIHEIFFFIKELPVKRTKCEE